jgi:hypothetical protein
MSDIHDLPPRMEFHNFALAINTKPRNTFFYRTSHALEDVLSPGYFDEAVECLIRRHDVIEVTANADGAAEFATLAVTAVSWSRNSSKSVEVSKLERR